MELPTLCGENRHDELAKRDVVAVSCSCRRRRERDTPHQHVHRLDYPREVIQICDCTAEMPGHVLRVVGLFICRALSWCKDARLVNRIYVTTSATSGWGELLKTVSANRCV